MVKERGIEYSKGPPGLKSGQKRTRTVMPRPYDLGPFLARASSPGKSVHFGRKLIQGPTVVDPKRRSESPSRSALHTNRRDDGPNTTSAQLQAEANAEQGRSVSREAFRKQAEEVEALISGRARKVPKKSEQAVKTVSAATVKTTGSKPTAAQATGAQASIEAEEIEQADVDVCTQMDDLRSMSKRFAESFKDVPARQKAEVLTDLLKPGNEQLVRYIGCLSMGGRDGVEGWRTLLADTTCRRALVLGIVGRAVKENVFGELCFGAPPALTQKLQQQERAQMHQDGFFRTSERAKTIDSFFAKHNDTTALRRAVARVTIQLEQMLLPLWKLNGAGNAASWKNTHKRTELAAIVLQAAETSRTIRKQGDVVCYWPPTFKDEEFEPARMECYNMHTMIHDSPYDKQTVNGIERAIVRPGREDESEAIVRVVCFPGLVAYRQGGGDLAKRELEKEKAHDARAPPDVRKVAVAQGQQLDGSEGFRTRVICKSVVLLQWGKQRLLTKEAGTSRHLDAMKASNGMQKYDDDYAGFKELADIFNAVKAGESVELQLEKEKSPSRAMSWSLPRVPSWLSRSPSREAGV